MQGPAVVLFIQAGCPACHEFLPRFKRVAEPYRQCGVKVYAPDLAKDSRAAEMADKYKIKATPTMLVFSKSGRATKIEGAVDDSRIETALGRFSCDV